MQWWVDILAYLSSLSISSRFSIIINVLSWFLRLRLSLVKYWEQAYCNVLPLIPRPTPSSTPTPAPEVKPWQRHGWLFMYSFLNIGYRSRMTVASLGWCQRTVNLAWRWVEGLGVCIIIYYPASPEYNNIMSEDSCHVMLNINHHLINNCSLKNIQSTTKWQESLGRLSFLFTTFILLCQVPREGKALFNSLKMWKLWFSLSFPG